MPCLIQAPELQSWDVVPHFTKVKPHSDGPSSTIQELITSYSMSEVYMKTSFRKIGTEGAGGKD